MILGAGLGSRMGDLTADTPKPLLEVAGKPLLGHLTDRLVQAGVAEIFVNLHYRAERMRAYLQAHPVSVPVHARTEPELTGPAGALRLFATELREYDAVLVASADVIVGEPLGGLVATHLARPAPLTFACTRVREARRYGVLDIGTDDEVRGAQEKPDVPDDDYRWISAGVYCLDPRVISRIPGDRVYDYAKDLAPALIADGRRVGVHRLGGYWRDVGTPEALDAARADAAAGRIPWLGAVTAGTEAQR
ncbi:NDP-sugar synthase [Streptomyces sp. NPDC008001]|uniref:nucleotidyltransferase family protein n=1 Tax=Streptomyces sp. NPDC008001 TaxID=3364804 RepID=UPI0036EBC1F3